MGIMQVNIKRLKGTILPTNGRKIPLNMIYMHVLKNQYL